MKKIIAVFAVLLVALAQAAIAYDTEQTGAVTGLKEKAKDMRADMTDRAKEMQDKMKEMRSTAKDMKPIAEEARNQMKARRASVKEMQESLKDCKGQKTEGCEQKRKNARLNSKEILLKAEEDMTGLLQAAKERILQSALDNKEKLVAGMDERLNKMAEAKAKADALTEESTQMEIKGAAKELREAVTEGKRALRTGAHKMVYQKMGGVLKSSEQLKAKLEKMLEKLQEKGADTSGIALDAFKTKLTEAEALHAEAAKLFESAKTAEPGQKDELMKQSTGKLREARKALMDAHTMLREIVQQIKEKSTAVKEAKPGE